MTAYTLRTPKSIIRRAAEQGASVAEFADRLFDGPLPWSRIRQGHKLLRLGERYTPLRLDAACRRALEVDLIDVRRVELILVQALEHNEMPEHPPPLTTGRLHAYIKHSTATRGKILSAPPITSTSLVSAESRGPGDEGQAWLHRGWIQCPGYSLGHEDGRGSIRNVGHRSGRG